MSFEHRAYRQSFLPEEVVVLRQVCFTPSRLFEPGKYIAGQLPDIAFEMGLVESLPPVRGKSAEIRPAKLLNSPAEQSDQSTDHPRDESTDKPTDAS